MGLRSVAKAGIQKNEATERKLRQNAVQSLEPRRMFSISSTTAGGNWDDTGTWVGGVVPGNSVDAVIVAGATVTVSQGEGAALLTTQPGSTLNVHQGRR